MQTLNMVQKVIISIFVAMVVILTFIHNPFSGYIITINNPLYDSGVHKVECTQHEMDNFRADFEIARKSGLQITNKKEDEQAYIDSSVAECTKSVPYEITAPLSEWKSKEPIHSWFGYILNLVQIIMGFSIILGSIFYLFKDSDIDQD